MSKARTLLASVIILLASLIFTSSSYAVFNLTVQPTNGGYDLRFGRVAPTDFKQVQEVLLTINTDIGKQYRITQQLISPLKATDGTELPPEQFKMYPLVNSNTRGTLLYREETPVSNFETVFYTSDSAGTGDSMRLVYTITPQDGQVPGSYYGRIAFVLSPVASTENQVIVTFNVYVELSGTGVPAVEMVTSWGSKRLLLSSKSMRKREDVSFEDPFQINFKISNPAGGTYRIYQAFENSSLTSSQGQEFDLSRILFSAAGGSKGRVSKESDLKLAPGKMLIYESDAIGSPDEFEISLNGAPDFKFQTAGQYRGRLSYVIEMEKTTGSKSNVIDTLDVVVEIVPLFDIYVYSGDKEGVFLNFGEVSYKTGPKTSFVDIYVDSNQGRPYQVIQNVASPLVNKAGDKVPQDDFSVQVSDVQSDEETPSLLDQAQSVKEGETVIFRPAPTVKARISK